MTTVERLPTGTVTFFFTDVEGSTRLLQDHPDIFPQLIEDHLRLIRQAFSEVTAFEIRTEGDAFFAVFPSAVEAVAAAVAIQRLIGQHTWAQGADLKVRIGMHTGKGTLGGDDYVGLDVHRAARISAAGHGGQILISEATRILVERDLPEGASLAELGDHQFKDLEQPERVYQVDVDDLRSEFPPLRTASRLKVKLPEQPTSFIERATEAAEISELLEASRLVTLVGPGGTGKTRLAIRVADEAQERFGDGVFFVPLASVVDPDLVPSVILTTLSVPEVAGTEPIEVAVAYLASQRVCLVLDNFEQILPGATHVGRLLEGASQLTFLVTSRAPLRIAGEQEYPVPTLEVPGNGHPRSRDEIAGHQAVALFVDRARAVRPDFELTDENASSVAAITVKLDGLPLAIELAAARVRMLPPEALAARLDHALELLAGGARDLPTRQQTLRGAIQWSYDLLDPEEQTVFSRLAVFLGGGMLGELEAVVAPEAPESVFEHLANLIDQSLVRQDSGAGEPRFRMLETIREFAWEQLPPENRDDLRERHAATYLELAERLAPNLMTVDRTSCLDRLEAEHDNFRAALDWAREVGAADTAQKLAASLWRFWQMRGHLHEGRQQLHSVLELDGSPPLARAKGLEAAGGIEYWMGNMKEAEPYYQEALEIARAEGSDSEVANALYNLAFPHSFLKGFAEARQLLAQSLELYEGLHDEEGAAKVLFGIGTTELFEGETAKAHDLFNRSVGIFRQGDDVFSLGWALAMDGVTLTKVGEYEEARARLIESLPPFYEAGDISALVLMLNNFAALSLAEEDIFRALKLDAAADDLRRLSGTDLVTVSMNRLEGLEEASSGLDHEAVQAAVAEGRAMTVDEAVAYALSG